MEISQLFEDRRNLLEESKDNNNFPSQEMVLSNVIQHLLTAKLIDSEDFTPCYYNPLYSEQKLNGFTQNSSGERLQLFIIEDESIHTDEESELLISQRADYDKHFKKVERFLSSSFKGELKDRQDSDGIRPLVSKITSNEGVQQFDVFEIFLISLSATVSRRGDEVTPKRMYFKEETKTFKYKDEGESKAKDFSIVKHIIDLNFISNVIASEGNSAPLKVVFKDLIDTKIEVIKAADESNFESYLCVLNAEILNSLYKRYSSQMLDKNVRSFLQFRGVNKGIRKTIKEEPEKFIAYNNGLTITATSAKIITYKKTTYLESLDDFQIVNGGQTTASIYFSKKEGLDVSKVNVMAKINIAKNCKEKELNDLISKISEYSNSQARVSKVDLKSRNPQLIALKTLSKTVITPSGKKWFFERAKGDFNTQVRKSGNDKLKNEFPPSRRFTKEVLAKFFCSWGDIPWAVKEGGEKVFRRFIEKIDPNDKPESEIIQIDRSFYEELIAKVMMFKAMEEIYGQGKYSMGQLRSAAVPYSMAIIYSYTDGENTTKCFDFEKLWKEEVVKEDLRGFFKELLIVTNECIKKYSKSEDYGQYSKKQELWERIKNCSEVTSLIFSENSKKILNKYTK
ncbi:AIPR family protein [Pseudoalteromonas arctica]|uniref:AIPR family protein n=1 Tax=Pseudoalteromonas arctica TaxID=394751 RepID=A0ABU9TIC1_9GAMM